MKSPITRKWTETAQERQQRRDQSIELLRIRGDNRIPDPPRGVIPQPGSRKAVISWNAPMRTQRVAGYRVIKGRALYQTFTDPAVRQCDVSISAGSSVNVFVSSVSASGVESSRVQVIASATAEVGAPTDPVPPPAVVESADTTLPTGVERKLDRLNS